MSFITESTDELKRLIAEHPDYRIAVLAGEEANGGDYSWMYCSSIRFEVGELLDAEGPDDEKSYTDRDELFDDLCELIADNAEWGVGQDGIWACKLSDEEIEARAAEKMKEFEPFWTNVIFIWATN